MARTDSDTRRAWVREAIRRIEADFQRSSDTHLIPLTWALEVLRGAFVKGSGFEALAVPMIVLAGFAVVIFGASIAATRRRIAE